MIGKAVPWGNWDEWRNVQEIVREYRNRCVGVAVTTMAIWRQRAKLPVAVDATLALLEIVQCDPQVNSLSPEFALPDSCLGMMYGMVITRVVNLLTDQMQKGLFAVSVDKLAGQLEIPSWIVQLRHSSCHGSTYPSVSALRSAAFYILDKILIPRYWDQQLLCMSETACEQANTLTLSYDDVKDYVINGGGISLVLGKNVLVEFDDSAMHGVTTLDFSEIENEPLSRLYDLVWNHLSELSRITLSASAFAYGNRAFVAAIVSSPNCTILLRQTILRRCAEIDSLDADMLSSVFSTVSTNSVRFVSSAKTSVNDDGLLEQRPFLFDGSRVIYVD